MGGDISVSVLLQAENPLRSDDICTLWFPYGFPGFLLLQLLDLLLHRLFPLQFIGPVVYLLDGLWFHSFVQQDRGSQCMLLLSQLPLRFHCLAWLVSPSESGLDNVQGIVVSLIPRSSGRCSLDNLHQLGIWDLFFKRSRLFG